MSTLHEIKPEDKREEKKTGTQRPAYRHTHADANIHMGTVSYTHTQRPYTYTVSKNEHKHTTGMYISLPVGKAIVFCWELAIAKEHNDHKKNYCWLKSISPTLSIHAATV